MTERLGGWEVEGEIARGATGAVLRGRDPHRRDAVAIKLLDPARGLSPVGRERFRREVEVLSRLRHPHLVALRAVGEERGTPFLVMDLVEGESLAERLKRQGPLPAAEAARGVRDLALALHYAHGCGVLHRDVKPENVLLDRAGRFLLTDFGLALDLGSADQRLSRTGTLLGTPGYWAPEQASGDVRSVDARTDVWGLGATLFACLCGEPPFAGESLQALLRATLEQEPRFPAGVSVDAGLAALCLRCLARDPALRPANADELARALTLWLGRAQGGRRGRGAPGPLLAGGALAGALGAALVLAGTAPGEGRASSRDQGSPPAPLRSATRPGGSDLDDALAAARAAALAYDHPRARAAWERVLARDPDCVEALLGRAHVRHRAQDLAGALADCERAVALAPGSAPARARLARALSASPEGQARAAEELRRALELDPACALAHLVETEQRFGRNDLPGTHAAASRTLELDPGCEEAWRLRGLASFYQQRPEDGLSDLERAIALAPGQRDAWHLKGYFLQAIGRFPEAIEALEAAIAREEEAESRYYLAWSRLRAGDPAGAEVEASRTLELPGGATERTWALRALIREQRGDLRGAVEDAGAALDRLGPRTAEWVEPESLRVRGRARSLLGDPAGAVEDLRAYLARRPGDGAVRIVLAAAYGDLGEVEAGLREVDQVLELEPGSWEGRLRRALLLVDAGRHEEARRACEAARVVAPPAAQVFVRCSDALVALASGDPAGGLQELERAVAETRGEPLPRALRGLARALLGRPGAEEDCQAAIEVAPPGLVEPWIGRGIARLARGDRDGGRADLEEALRLLGPRAERSWLGALARRQLEAAR